MSNDIKERLEEIKGTHVNMFGGNIEEYELVWTLENLLKQTDLALVYRLNIMSSVKWAIQQAERVEEQQKEIERLENQVNKLKTILEKEMKNNNLAAETVAGLKKIQYELSSHVISKDKNIDHLLKENARLQVKILKSKNGKPTVIEYTGQRYILQHPDHRGRKK